MKTILIRVRTWTAILAVSFFGTLSAEPVKVGVYVGAGAQGNGVCHWEALMTLSPDVQAKFLDARLIAAGGLDGLDLLVMPGGDSVCEFKTLQTNGADRAVKDFIRNGGGYIGTCAGNCLVLNETNRLCLTPYARDATSGRHGTCLLSLKFNAAAKELCGIRPEARSIRYSGGPIMKPGAPVEGADIRTIATYDCDLVAHYGTNTTPVTAMRGAPAAIAGTYGRGRLFAIAVHPEYRTDTLDILEKAFTYVTHGRTVRLVRRQRRRGDLCVAVYAPTMEGLDDAALIRGLVTTPGLHATFMNQKEEIGVGYLDGADALVVPGGSPRTLKKKLAAASLPYFRRFLEQGGRILSYGTCATKLPQGAETFASVSDLLADLARKAAEPSR